MLGLKSSRKYYSGVDNLPIWNWNRIHETQNLNYLFVKDDYEAESIASKAGKFTVTPHLLEVWDRIYNEYLDYFGLPDEYLKYLNGKERSVIMHLDAYLTGDKSKITFAKIEMEKVKYLFKEDNKNSFQESLTILESSLSTIIDEKRMSVMKYFTHLSVLKKASNG